MLPISGQEVNSLTSQGVERLFRSPRLEITDPLHEFRNWITNSLLPYMFQYACFRQEQEQRLPRVVIM